MKNTPQTTIAGYRGNPAQALLDAEGIRIAPPELAKVFSIEGDDDVYDRQFGFHGFSWTDIDKWIDKHPEYPLIVKLYRQAREEYFEKINKRLAKNS